MSRYADVRAGFPKPQNPPSRQAMDAEFDRFKQALSTPSPLHKLLEERQRAVYLTIGGEEADSTIRMLHNMIKVGEGELLIAAERLRRKAADAEKPPETKPTVTSAQLIRAAAELRRWQLQRERLMIEAMQRVEAEIQTTEQFMRAQRDLEGAPRPDAMPEDLRMFSEALGVPQPQGPPLG